MGVGRRIKNVWISGLVWLLMVMFQAGCSPNKVRLSSEDEKFVRLYADVLLVQANYESLTDSRMRDFFKKEDSLKAVFAIHGVAPKEYNSLLEKYKQDPLLWKEVLSKTMQQLESRRQWLSEQPAKK
jgi:hypothetical protein